jgi:hypothetical protein
MRTCTGSPSEIATRTTVPAMLTLTDRPRQRTLKDMLRHFLGRRGFMLIAAVEVHREPAAAAPP